MKMKNILAIITLALVSQSALGAEVNVYNKTGQRVRATMKYLNSITKKYANCDWATIEDEGKHHFSSKGANSFIELAINKDDTIYIYPMRSSKTMLAGSITMNAGDVFTTNFDSSGASADKVKEIKIPGTKK